VIVQSALVHGRAVPSPRTNGDWHQRIGSSRTQTTTARGSRRLQRGVIVESEGGK